MTPLLSPTACFAPAATLQQTAKAPPRYDFERSLVGLRVQIYWPKLNKWFPGWITRFNVWRRKWKVEYDVSSCRTRALWCRFASAAAWC